MRLTAKTTRHTDGPHTSWTVELTADEHPEFKPEPRSLIATSFAGAEFPSPPSREKPLWENASFARFCEQDAANELQLTHQKVLLGRLGATDALDFGEYLWIVLFGDYGDAVCGLPVDGEPLEIEVEAEADDNVLNSLPWEMMATGGARLIDGMNRLVSISRVLVPQRVCKVGKLERPLKVLFVVGRRLDAQLRPGVELMGLLRQLRIPAEGQRGEFRNANVVVHFLNEATPDELTAAIAELRPAIVHFVCHGQLAPDGSGSQLLLTKRVDEHDENSAKTDQAFACSSSRLVSLMKLADDGWLPPVVLLNVCHTAEVLDSKQIKAGEMREHASFAARLVTEGVAIAIGMAGEIESHACQMFAVGFYQALVDSHSVTLATANGRRAARVAYESDSSMEWVRPIMFRAKGVPEVFEFASAGADVTAKAAVFLGQSRFPRGLCDRYEFLVEYQRLVKRVRQGGGSLVIAFPCHDRAGGVGKTRLLDEMASRAVFDGFIPVLHRSIPGSRPAPRNPFELALVIADCIDETRSLFDMNPNTSIRHAYELAFDRAGVVPALHNARELARQKRRIWSYLEEHKNADDLVDFPFRDARAIVIDDCEELIREVEAISGEKHRVLLAIDEFQGYWPIARSMLDMSGEFGFGNADCPIPLAFTYSAKEQHGGDLATLVKMRGDDVLSLELSCFEDDLSRHLAYRQLLLWGWQIAANPEKRKEVQTALDHLHGQLEGRPRNFKDKFADLDRTVGLLSELEIFVPADYEKLLLGVD